jgi:NCAIR mutase (PurE)-related protein
MPANRSLEEVLERFREGNLSLEETMQEISGLRLESVGELANLDLGRRYRCGVPEVILAEGKDTGHMAEIAMAGVRSTGRCIVSRVSRAQYKALSSRALEEGVRITCHEQAGMVVLSTAGPVVPTGGVVGIITAGTSDIRAAEEARVIAEEMGCRTCTAYDVGAAGIHRLFPALKKCLGAHVYVVAAGREGTLPAIVAGLVDQPVIGVPISTGYGYMGKGQAALASMLQSCSVLAVVNIDAGFTAGAFAARIANMAAGS